MQVSDPMTVTKTATLQKAEELLLLAAEFLKIPDAKQKKKWRLLLSAIRRAAKKLTAAVKAKANEMEIGRICRKLRTLLSLLDRRLERATA